jgi:plastocyanin
VASEVEAANATPSPEPSGPPASGEPAPPSGPPASGEPAPPSGEVLQVTTTADDPLAFDPTTLTATAGSDVRVEYLNDSPVPHNIAFFEGSDSSAPRIAATTIATGPGMLETVEFKAPETPGQYHFHCDVHPTQMVGDFEVVS